MSGKPQMYAYGKNNKCSFVCRLEEKYIDAGHKPITLLCKCNKTGLYQMTISISNIGSSFNAHVNKSQKGKVLKFCVFSQKVCKKVFFLPIGLQWCALGMKCHTVPAFIALLNEVQRTDFIIGKVSGYICIYIAVIHCF